MHIDLQRLLNYLLLFLTVCAGITTGLLASRAVDLSLGGGEISLPKPTVQQTRARQLQEKDFQVILDRSLFNAQTVGKLGEEFDLSLAKSSAKEERPVSKPVGNLELIGTVVAGENSLALIQVGKKPEVYRLEAELAPGVVLVEVYRNKVMIREQGVKRELFLKPSQKPTADLTRPEKAPEAKEEEAEADDGIVSLSENRWQISRETVENARNNFNTLLSSARMVPQIEDGQTIGFRLVQMKRGSLLEKIGLKRGDILVEINQLPLDSPEKALQIVQQLREATNLSLGLIRDGERQTFEYSLE